MTAKRAKLGSSRKAAQRAERQGDFRGARQGVLEERELSAKRTIRDSSRRLRMGTLFLQHGAAVFPCPTDYIVEFCLIAFRAAALKPREVVKVNAECD